ncbi:MAG TPA: ABC transporter permease, partial [Gammaproteobacteria bacterium]|nr:ABC transporter permease [Gammaproteobacteria bacterium]
MLGYICRRILYTVPILIGVNILTFALFFLVNTPDDIARIHLGQKHVTQEAIQAWKIHQGYDKPLFLNHFERGPRQFTNTIFFEKSLKLFAFDFGRSDAGSDISHDILQRMWPSLAIAVPALIVGLLANIAFALFIVFFRHTYLDVGAIILCVCMMSISTLFYIVGVQYLISKLWRL